MLFGSASNRDLTYTLSTRFQLQKLLFTREFPLVSWCFLVQTPHYM